MFWEGRCGLARGSRWRHSRVPRGAGWRGGWTGWVTNCCSITASTSPTVTRWLIGDSGAEDFTHTAGEEVLDEAGVAAEYAAKDGVEAAAGVEKDSPEIRWGGAEWEIAAAGIRSGVGTL